jgi:indoleamine 2,3-dioxygenase
MYHEVPGPVVHVDQWMMPNELNWLQEMRHYMPGPHRRFLELMEEKCYIKEYVSLQSANHALREAYYDAVGKLRGVRDAHISLVTRYILIPRVKLGAGDRSTCQKQLIGTGGTDVIRFLKRSRDETKATVLDE